MGTIAKNTPLVSIVLPTYNRANYLSRSIRSVIEQDYQNWELLVIDNNSIDQTDYIVNGFCDTRVKLYKINNEGSIGMSRNLGIMHSKGEWIAFLDSDDWWFPNKLSVCLDECKNSADFIFHDLRIAIDDQVCYFRKVSGWKLKSPILRDLLVRGNAIANSSAMVRKSVFEKIGKINENIEINPCVDYHTWLKVSTITDSFLYIPKSLGVYRVHGGGVSQRDMSLSHEKSIYEFTKILSKSELAAIERKITFMHARYLYVNKQRHEIAPLLLECICLSDWKMTAKAIFMLAVSYLFRVAKPT